MKRQVLSAALIALLAFASMASTYAAEPTEAQREVAQVKIEEMRARLKLTPEQEEKIAPLVKERNEKLKTLRASTDPNASKAQKREQVRQAKEIQDNFVASVKPVLTSEQMKEWEAIRKETREAMRERWRNR